MRTVHLDTGGVVAFPSGEPIDPPRPNGGIGHNSGAALPSTKPAKRAEPTVFQQIEAVLDCEGYSAQQKCIILKIRCRVDGRTLTGALVSNAGLMQAASIADWRTLRAELRDLEGKSRAIPKDEARRPVEDTIDPEHALIIREERSGKATTFALTPERMQAIVSAYMELKERKKGAKPPASNVGGTSDVPPGTPCIPCTHPLHPVQGDPLHPMQTDPFPSSIYPDSHGADAPGVDATSKEDAKPPTKRTTAKPKATEEQFGRFWTAYPKREGKAAARKNLLALTRDDAELAIAGAEAYARKCRGEGKDPKYIKWPQGWLSERRFEDYAAEPAPQSGGVPPLQPGFYRRKPLLPTTAAGWQQVIDACVNGDWPEDVLGPPPGAPGCVIPLGIIPQLRLKP